MRMFRRPRNGAVAQLGERLVRNEEVRGSIPLSSTTVPRPVPAPNPWTETGFSLRSGGAFSRGHLFIPQRFELFFQVRDASVQRVNFGLLRIRRWAQCGRSMVAKQKEISALP